MPRFSVVHSQPPIPDNPGNSVHNVMAPRHDIVATTDETRAESSTAGGDSLPQTRLRQAAHSMMANAIGSISPFSTPARIKILHGTSNRHEDRGRNDDKTNDDPLVPAITVRLNVRIMRPMCSRADDRGDRRRPHDDAKQLVAKVAGRQLEYRSRRIARVQTRTLGHDTQGGQKEEVRITAVIRIPDTELRVTWGNDADALDAGIQQAMTSRESDVSAHGPADQRNNREEKCRPVLVGYHRDDGADEGLTKRRSELSCNI